MGIAEYFLPLSGLSLILIFYLLDANPFTPFILTLKVIQASTNLLLFLEQQRAEIEI